MDVGVVRILSSVYDVPQVSPEKQKIHLSPVITDGEQ
jgi:hypothetical protein